MVGGGWSKIIEFRRVGGGESNGRTIEVVGGGGCSREFEREGEFDRNEAIHFFECDRCVLFTGMLS